MDVTANNISNVNTVGFKSASVSLRDALSQLGARRKRSPPPSRGGTNAGADRTRGPRSAPSRTS